MPPLCSHPLTSHKPHISHHSPGLDHYLPAPWPLTASLHPPTCGSISKENQTQSHSCSKSPWLPSTLERNDETSITQPPPTGLPSPPPLLPHSVPASRTSWLCLVYTKVIPTSGPLHVLFPLPGMLFPWLGTKPREGKFFAQSHTARKGKSSDSNLSCPALDHTQASHPLPSSNQAPRGPSRQEAEWGRGHIAAETPVRAGPAGQRDQPPNAMFLPW